jgi:hypothetical protein
LESASCMRAFFASSDGCGVAAIVGLTLTNNCTHLRHQCRLLAFSQGQAGIEQLSLFVLDAENAISREHTLWLAKRA